MLQDFLSLLQLVSPALPVGAYSYSEGLEWLIHQGIIHDAPTLEQWLVTELKQGSIRVELAILLRAYRAAQTQNLATLKQWNAYLSANWDSAELRQQSWQMGQSLSRLVGQLYPAVQPMVQALGTPCNYAIVWGMAAAQWELSEDLILLGYGQSWLSNLISAGVRLIPLGQTQGQQMTQHLHLPLVNILPEIQALTDEDLYSCSWGLALASMNHESQYTRLFRS